MVYLRDAGAAVPVIQDSLTRERDDGIESGRLLAHLAEFLVADDVPVIHLMRWVLRKRLGGRLEGGCRTGHAVFAAVEAHRDVLAALGDGSEASPDRKSTSLNSSH